MEEALRIESSDGVILSGRGIFFEGSPFCLIFTHPYAMLGGNKENNVVKALYSYFGGQKVKLKSEIVECKMSVVRFDFRGAGDSSGRGSWRGMGEVEDLRNVCSFLYKNKGIKKVLIVGYSYGAVIGSRVAGEMYQKVLDSKNEGNEEVNGEDNDEDGEDKKEIKDEGESNREEEEGNNQKRDNEKESRIDEIEIVGSISIAYPFSVLWALVLFNTREFLTLSKCELPKLFILGTDDNFTSVSSFQSYLSTYPSPKQIELLPNCDHFFWGNEKKLQPIIQNWILQNLTSK